MKYFKVGVDGIKASSSEQALSLYEEYHGFREDIAEQVPANLEVDLFSGDFPDDLLHEHITVHDVFWYYRTKTVIEEMFL